ncbi:heparinase II/III domain-containing protein [Methylobacterium radiodurans]|uniref:heparinase II/III domain-containing protein n=1 Tax=Methylobacterium radiodurans TaxID=2202828 RepID=UPI0013A5BCA0|nr:heparinase II/III family protein [Methylobacterium radiodurans]
MPGPLPDQPPADGPQDLLNGPPPDPAPDAGAPDPDTRIPVTARYAGGAGAGGRPGEHVVAAKNRWARAVLGFRDLAPDTWYALDLTLAWDPEEPAGAALDFALAGFDFLAPDGSSLDFEAVPGLVRTLPDPHGIWLPGPAYRPEGARAAALRLAFRMPAPASDLALGFRSWRNTAPFRVSGVRLRPVASGHPAASAFRLPRRRLGPEPLVLAQTLVPGAGLVLRGQIFSERPDEHAAYAGLRYRDAAGAELPLPYPDAVSVPGHGASVNLPARPQARRFTLTLRPPAGAASVELGFRTWEDADENPPAVELVAAPEVALEEPLRLESLCGDDLLDGPSFLARLAERLGLEPGAEAGWMPGTEPGETDGGAASEATTAAEMPAAPPLALARTLRRGPEGTGRGADGRPVLRLAGLPDWPLPDPPDWRADPYRSVPWRLDYQSLAWLAPLEREAPALAAAWAARNPWGQPADPLSLHPAALSLRAEVLAGLAAGPLPAEEAGLRPVLVGAAAQHGVALAEIVGQNAFGRSLHGVQAAAALLVVARALPRLPLAPFWDSLALRSLGEAVAALVGPDGRFAEPALQRRLDLLGLGRALAAYLAGEAPGPDIAARFEAGLAGLPGLLDPGGRLPPFGDAPPAGDEAAWVARLLTRGPDLVAAREVAPERAPDAVGGFAHDTLSARAEAVGRGAAHFACTFAPPQGHADCTSFVLATEGVRWIVEAGGSESLEAGAARHYLVSARAHNVAVLDGHEPVSGPAWHAGALRLDGAAAHRIETRLYGPDVAHARIFLLLDELDGVAVIDRFRGAASNALAFEGLLHLAPEAIVALSGPRRALAQQGARRLNLVPWIAEGRAAGLTLVNGRSEPPGALQGFVAGQRGLVPASTLSYALAGRGTVCGGMLIATDLTVEERLTRLLAGEAMRGFLAE